MKCLTAPAFSSARSKPKTRVFAAQAVISHLLDSNQPLWKISVIKNRWKRYRLPRKVDEFLKIFAKFPLGHKILWFTVEYYVSRFGESLRCDAEMLDWPSDKLD